MNNKQNFLRKLGGAFWVLVAGLLAILMVSIVKAPGAKQPYYKPNVFPPTSFRLARENFTELERELKEFVDSQPGEVGLYFFDLTTGGHFGINEKEPLPAASSIKVPVALYLYEQVAANKISLDEQMAYDPDVHWSGGAGTIRWNAYPGQLFTLGELARKLIRESDNVAWRMLTNRLGQDNIEAFMKNLGGKTVFPGEKTILPPKTWLRTPGQLWILPTATLMRAGSSWTIWYIPFIKTVCRPSFRLKSR